MRKSDVPWINKGPVQKAILGFVIGGFCMMCFSDPELRKDLPGIFDGAVGLACGFLFGRMGWNIAFPGMIADYNKAKGSFWYLLWIDSFSPTKLLLGLVYAASIICALVMAWVLRSQTGLTRPWCQTEELPVGAFISAFFGFVVTYSMCHALWYDSLPD